jgi:hypothetical protein
MVDAAVLRSIAKWPDVPAAYGWLLLDPRGDWHVKGDRITNPAVVAFIGRNYTHDADGRWYFQNGPQRVFVTLGYTPLVARTVAGPALGLETHTGQPIERVDGVWLDERGALLLGCLGTVAVLHDRDLEAALPALCDGRDTALADAQLEEWLGGAPLPVHLRLAQGPVPVERIERARVAARFGFDPAPRPRPGEPEC